MYLDLIIAIPILWGMFRGFKKGFIIELSTLMALVLGIYGAAAFGRYAGTYLEDAFNTDPRLSLVLAFAIVFVAIVAAVFIFGKILESAIKLVALGLVNKLFGLLFGGAKFLLIISALIFVINGFPFSENLIPTQWKRESALYPFTASLATDLYPVLKNNTWFDGIEDKWEDFKEEIVP